MPKVFANYYQQMIQINKQRKAELIAEIEAAKDSTQIERKQIELKKIKVELINWLEAMNKVEAA